MSKLNDIHFENKENENSANKQNSQKESSDLDKRSHHSNQSLGSIPSNIGKQILFLQPK